MVSLIRLQLHELISHRLVLWQLVKLQLTMRYRRTVLGYLWTLVNPLLMMSVTALVFSMLLKMDLKVYAVFLFAGLVPWWCFSTVVQQSTTAIIANEGLIKKIYLPRMIFPISLTLGMLIDSVFSFFALFALICLIGAKISCALLFLPVCFTFLFCLSLGIAFVLSIATVYFRDLQHIIGILMQAFFFLTPVMYRPEQLAGKLARVIELNPLTPFILMFRSTLVMGELPSIEVIGQSAAYAAVSLIIGFVFFLLQQNKVVYRL